MKSRNQKFACIVASLSLTIIFSGCTTTAEKTEPQALPPEVKPVATPPPVIQQPRVETPKAEPAPVKRTIQYNVQRGDNLWDISAKPEIYGDAHHWPLIYKLNQGDIKDADLIYPGQLLTIDKQPSAADVSAAVRHAQTRGPWKLGVTEESDKNYLGR